MEFELKRYPDGTAQLLASGKPEEFVCRFCRKPIKEGFHCENLGGQNWCPECHENYNIARLCGHDANGEHRHIKFIKKNGV